MVIAADMYLVAGNAKNTLNPTTPIKNRARSAVTAVGFGVLATRKILKRVYK